MHLPSWNHDENAWKFCFVHLVEVQNHLEPRCREPCASPTADRNETGEQAAEDSNERAKKSGKMALKNAPKHAQYRTKILQLMGVYCWLIDRQGKALKWWAKAINEGERLGARPDLSRTYFEVGKRLLAPDNKHKKLNGIDADGYLEKAGILFEEMGLERDMDDLKKITSAI